MHPACSTGTDDDTEADGGGAHRYGRPPSSGVPTGVLPGLGLRAKHVPTRVRIARARARARRCRAQQCRIEREAWRGLGRERVHFCRIPRARTAVAKADCCASAR